ncbi:MAG: hypothetical protein MJ228_05005 [Bacilli bacterium]|nr:hypothetical protein [Bacilli bacterium]
MNKKLCLTLTIAAFCLSSCNRLENALEKGVLWYSEETSFQVSMQNDNLNGVASLVVNGVKTKMVAEFSDSPLGLRLYSQSNDFPGYPGSQDLLFSVKDVHVSLFGGSTMAISCYDNHTGDPYYDSFKTTLKKRSLSRDEMDAKMFVGNSWANEDESLALIRERDTVFDGKMSVRINKVWGGFFRFLDDGIFELEDKDGNMSEGTYETVDCYSMVLRVSKGALLEKFGNVIKMENRWAYDVARWEQES